MACITFGAKALKSAEIEGKRVLEIGSIDVNGTLRPVIESWSPAQYVGIDVVEGPGVDRVCRAENMVSELGANSFDVVIATEIIEHVPDWRSVISNIKQVCKPGGVILITTPSKGFPYHAYPHDYWRYEQSDMKDIFEDCTIELLENSRHALGVFVKVRKPLAFQEKNLSNHALYSIVARERVRELDDTLLKKEKRKKFWFDKLAMPLISLSSGVARTVLRRL
jgi:SAM-dependent methyltransferase